MNCHSAQSGNGTFHICETAHVLCVHARPSNAIQRSSATPIHLALTPGWAASSLSVARLQEDVSGMGRGRASLLACARECVCVCSIHAIATPPVFQVWFATLLLGANWSFSLPGLADEERKCGLNSNNGGGCPQEFREGRAGPFFLSGLLIALADLGVCYN